MIDANMIVKARLEFDLKAKMPIDAAGDAAAQRR